MASLDETHYGDRLGYRLFAASARLHAAYDTVLQPDDLSVTGYVVLRILSHQPGRSQAQIARVMQMTPQSMSPTIAALHDAGLIERRPAPSGGRALETHLTAAGLQVLRRAESRLDTLDAQLLDGLHPPTVLDTLARLASTQSDRPSSGPSRGT